jgi:menaquinone-dependent protoporphyrinogen oxidase
MVRILVAYAGWKGQTERVALRIGQVLRAYGHDVSQLDSPSALARALLDRDAVVIGGAVRYGRHARALERAVRENADFLTGFPNAFFSVSMSAAHAGPRLAQARAYVDRFIARTKWQPDTTALFAGALAYTRYPRWMRWMMRLISRRTGGATDTSRDHEYTDWPAVERFAREFARSLAPGRTKSVVPEPVR